MGLEPVHRPYYRVPAGTKFPVPSGKLWDEMTKKHELREKELRLDHLQNQAAASTIGVPRPTARQ